MTQLSEHFSLAEMTHTSQPFPNVPNALETANLRTLCRAVLEPIRAHFQLPVHINSGFRSELVNEAVGSKFTSQHRKGEAVDIEIPGISNYELAKWIRESLAFDQLILENYTPGQPSSGWVHVSYRAGRLRKSVLTMVIRSHGASYLPGLQT